MDYIREKVKKTEQIDAKSKDILLLFEEKELYLTALLGDYGNIRFTDKLKNEFFSDGLDHCVPKDNAMTPYLLEFNISTAFSLIRLWQRRQKDLPPDQLFHLIDTLVNSGTSSVK